ncbi:MAG: alpha/beta hydrolase [Deltaproteobacteria bacterium]|nr:MAG: alpha/beta hydrolase [Deltaproteobacteria bacterium]
MNTPLTDDNRRRPATGIKPVLQTKDVGDTSIQYLFYDGRGPALVFLHATGFMPWIWHPIAREFAGDYQVIVPYFCDHRHADPHKGGLSWLQIAEDLARFCKQLDIQAPTMISHSMGGAVITLAAGKFGLAADRMILFEPIFLPSQLYNLQINVEDHPLAGKAIKRRNFWEDLESAREYLKSKPLFSRWDQEMLEMYLTYGFKDAKGRGVTLVCHPEREASLFMGSMSYDPWPLIPHIECPVLVLEGELSENRNLIDFRKAANTFPNGGYRIVEGTGHLIPMENPAKTTRLIRDFINEAI